MTDLTLLDALDALALLPPAAPAGDIAKIARDLIGARRTAFFGTSDEGVARTGVDEFGNVVVRPPRTAADLEPFYVAGDAGDGLAPLYDLEPGPWVSIRLDVAHPRGAIIADGLAALPDAEQIRTWRAFGATLALRLAMTNELIALAERADVDTLTGVSLRRVADQAIDRRLRDGLPTTLIVADLDGLKHINDTLGHKAGDDFIVRAATALRDACRQSDIVARFGGDEFIVVSDVSPDTLLPRLNSALAAVNVAASLGAATSLLDGQTRQALFDSADSQMYSTKRSRKAMLELSTPNTDAIRPPQNGEALR